jgi:S1-C subfamily serine protease
VTRAAIPVLGMSAAVALALPGSAGPPPPGPPIVRVVADPGTTSREVATGFEARPGRIVTVTHAVVGTARVLVRGERGPGREARVLRLDRRSDLALLAVTGPSPSIAPARGAGGLRLLVRRGARPARVRRRIVARVRRAGGGPVYVRPALELAAQVRPGDSGAPVVDAGGRLAGVVFARSERRGDVAYAVDAAAVDRLLREGRPRRR